MKRIIFHLILVISSTVAADSCSACFHRLCYNRELLLEATDTITLLSIDRHKNAIYLDLKGSERDYNILFQLSYNTASELISRHYTVAVDCSTNETYVSQGKGVVKYDIEGQHIQLPGLELKEIWKLQYKDKLYYLDRDGKLFSYNDESNEPILSNYTVTDFVVDKNNDVFFTTEDKGMVLRNGKVSTLLRSSLTLASNKDGVPYFIQPMTRTLYTWDYTRNVIVDAGVFAPGMMANDFVIDNRGHVIYHDNSANRLFGLEPNEKKCRVGTLVRGKEVIKTIIEEDDEATTKSDQI